MASNRPKDELDAAYTGEGYQLRLFNPRPREVCYEIGLNWLAALRLRDSGWLSFDLEGKTVLTEPEENELRFIGVLVAFGLDESQLGMILKGLRKPYRYVIERMYFDFQAKMWRLIPRSPDIGKICELIDLLKQEGEIDDLRSLYEQIAEALEEMESPENDEDKEKS
jgi:hypothetical protein